MVYNFLGIDEKQGEIFTNIVVERSQTVFPTVYPDKNHVTTLLCKLFVYK